MCSVLGNLTPGVTFWRIQRGECGIHGEEGKPGGPSASEESRNVPKSENNNHFNVNSARGLNYNPTRLENKTPGINNWTFCGISTQGILGVLPPCSAGRQGRKVSATLDSKR